MIRVACDVSFAAPLPGRQEVVTGVGRVIKELLLRLQQIPDLEVKAVGSFGGDWNPVSTSIQAQRWAARLTPRASSMPAYRSRLGLSRLLGPLQVGMESRRHSRSLGLRLLRRLLRLDAASGLNGGGLDVFHATFLPPPDDLPSALPRVVFIHDVYPARFPQHCGASACGTLDTIIRRLDASRDYVICNSEFTQRDFCELAQFPAERVTVAPLAAAAAFSPVLDPARIESLREKYQLGTAPYLLSVANPQPRKNLITAIHAMRILAEALPDWDGRLVLAGNAKAGWGSEEIDALLESTPKLAARIQRIGPADEADLPALYSGALAFVFPSTYEGFGLPVLEAMGCGVPVVCSNTTSLPEVAGSAALMVDPLDAAGFAEALQRLIQQPELRARLATAGRERAASFTWSRTAEKVAEAFRLAARPSR